MSAANAKLAKILRSGSVFVVINVMAGLLHYLFQVFASQRLSAAEFSSLNSWFANLALFFLLGGILQYAANFFPAKPHRLRQAVLAINVLAILLVVLWPATPHGQTIVRALMILLGSSAFGWLIGQLQIRLMFNTMTAANVLLAVTKLLLITIPMGARSPLEVFSFALFACYLPALWLASVMAWRNRVPVVGAHDNAASGVVTAAPNTLDRWAAPVLLSIATAVIPQMDLVLMSHIQTPEVFQDFARASLFYKGIYFFIYIFAQWLLPFQIRERDGGLVKASLYIAIAAVAGSSAMTIAAPWIVAFILHWQTMPSLVLIFASCLNMSLLTWAFLLIQESCAQGRTGVATVALVILAIEATLQLGLGLNAVAYLALAAAVQIGIVFVLTGNAATQPRIAVNIPR